ncbi:MAG: helicase-related protein, partial [Vicinamibacterales bacterium]
RTPMRVSIAREKPAAGRLPRVRQVAYTVPRAHKPAALERLLDTEDPAATLVFCRTRQEVEALTETLNAHGHRAEALHGGMAQRQRDRVMALFRAKQADLLVATDVAARGLDIEHLSHVVNYDVPSAPEVYLHRIGRTGRAGRGGTAITLAEPREQRLLRAIEQFTKARVDHGVLPTVAELRARRLDLTRASLREQLVAGDLDRFRVVLDGLTPEFDLVDIAAAAVKLAHTASGGDRDDVEIPSTPSLPPRRQRRAGEEPSAGEEPRATGKAGFRPGSRGDAGASDRASGRGGSGRPRGEAQVRLFIGAGRRAGIRPGDLVGAITAEAGVQNRSLGAIEIADAFSLIDVPETLADRIVAAMRKTTLRGKRVTVRRERSD